MTLRAIQIAPSIASATETTGDRPYRPIWKATGSKRVPLQRSTPLRMPATSTPPSRPSVMAVTASSVGSSAGARSG